MHADSELPILLLKKAVAAAEIKFLPASHFIIVKVIQYLGQRGVDQSEKNATADADFIQCVNKRVVFIAYCSVGGAECSANT